MSHHELKIEPDYFDMVLRQRKTFEIRYNDQNYQVEDTVLLKEYDSYHGEFSGRAVEAKITYIVAGPKFGIADGWVVFSIRLKEQET